MSGHTGTAFREALGAAVAARQAADATPDDPGAEEQAGQAYRVLWAAAQAHANEAGHVHPVPVPGRLGQYTPAPLVAAYERLRDDPSADPADTRAAAEALATARMAHRVAAGLPLRSGVS